MASLPEIPAEIGGYAFASPSLLREALTHAVAQRRDAAGNPFDSERLEFLGDAVLGLVLADALHSGRPDAREGELSSCRAALASRATLAAAAVRLGLPAFIDAGDDAPASSRIRETDSSAENAFEALVGAVYRDAGYPSARRSCCAPSVTPSPAFARSIRRKTDCRKSFRRAPRVTTPPRSFHTGPSPFRARPRAPGSPSRVWFDDACRGRGEGVSVKVAGEAAAREALEAL